MKINIKTTSWLRKGTKIFLITITCLALLTTSACGASKGYDYYSAVRLRNEGAALLSAGNYKASIDKFTLALAKWSPEALKESLHESLDEAKRFDTSSNNYAKGVEFFEEDSWENALSYLKLVEEDDQNYVDARAKVDIAQKKLEEQDKKKEPDSSQGNVAGATTSGNFAKPAGNNQTQPITSNPQTNVGSTAPAQTTPTPTSSLWPSEPERHDTYPIIIKVSDNLGNFTTGSSGNGIPFFVTWPESKPTLKIGQIVLITVEAEDPNGDPLEYQFKNNQNEVVQDWSGNKTFSWVVTQETGGNPFIVPAIRDNDSTLRFGDSDDSTVLYYQLE